MKMNLIEEHCNAPEDELPWTNVLPVLPCNGI